MQHSDPEITIVGGGLVGLSVALGLLSAGRRVRVLDGADGGRAGFARELRAYLGTGQGLEFPALCELDDGCAGRLAGFCAPAEGAFGH